MCFNKEVSLATYLIGIIGSFQLYQQRFTPEALFYAWVVHMQLFEFFIWKNQPCNETNVTISKYGIIWNHLEPFVLWLGIIYYSKLKLPNNIHLWMIVFAVWTYKYTKDVFKSECTTITPISSPHLHWKWNEGPYYDMFYSAFLATLIVLSYFGLQKGYINAIIVFVSFMISKHIYGETHSTGAMWCFLAAFAPVLYPILHQQL